MTNVLAARRVGQTVLNFSQSPDDGISQVVESYRVGDDVSVGEVPQDLEECVREAAEGCPVEAIHVEE